MPVEQQSASAGRAEVSAETSGVVLVELYRPDGASVLLEVAPADDPRKALVRTPGGIVSYRSCSGMSGDAAVTLARSYGQRVGAGALANDFPHLAPPAPDPALTDALPLSKLLSPELTIDGPAFHAFVLKKLSGNLLQLKHVSDPISFDATLEASTDGFRIDDRFSLRLQRINDTVGKRVPFGVASACSHLAVLLRRKNAGHRLVENKAAVEEKPPPPQTLHPEIAPHLYALHASGYTVLRGVLKPDELRSLRKATDRALQRSIEITDAGKDATLVVNDAPGDTTEGSRFILVCNRSMYCWGDPLVKLLESDLVRKIGESVLGPHKLFDMMTMSLEPKPRYSRTHPSDHWHRDIRVSSPAEPIRYLALMFLLDDYTAENGGTWVLPGSHRALSVPFPDKSVGASRSPSAVQITGKAGDLLVFTPTLLHSWGHNTTEHPRRVMSIWLSRSDVPVTRAHWTIAGPALQSHASERLRQLLQPEAPAANPVWEALPPGWIKAEHEAVPVPGVPPDQVREDF